MRCALLGLAVMATLAALRPELAPAAVPESVRAALLEQARAQGPLPVIVSLDVPWREGEVTPAEAAAQEQAAARAQAQLLQDLGVAAAADGELSGPGVTNVKLLGTSPVLALTATPEALERLLAHPLVRSAQEDAAIPPATR